MPPLAQVRQSNSLLKNAKPGLVAVFAGATNGIGEQTCKEFVLSVPSPTVYLVGRNKSKSLAIVEQLQALNSSATLTFIEADLTLLSNVERVHQLVSEKEKKVNLLFMSQGFLSLQGRQETTEGLDKLITLQYYSRLRLIVNFTPLLQKATESADLARIVNVLGAGNEGKISLTDMEVKSNYTLNNATRQAMTMTSLAMGHLSYLNPEISFLHVYPGPVRGTGITRGMGPWIHRIGHIAMSTVGRPWSVGLSESGKRHLYAATSEVYAPSHASISDSGSFFRLTPDGELCAPNDALLEYEQDGIQRHVWEATQAVFKRVLG
ncbi:hypothetical protein EDB80DRAFT_880424 [Ilyonectria destructans]|nr:hypothetical protein EDB80DRAFT_880424 [Ilyonectria destructans]